METLAKTVAAPTQRVTIDDHSLIRARTVVATIKMIATKIAAIQIDHFLDKEFSVNFRRPERAPRAGSRVRFIP
jgi:hypothetical protein